MIRSRAPRRGGFTLIELLTVIAILSILAALTTAGVARVRSAQQAKASDNTLTKLQLALDAQWLAVVGQCHKDRMQKPAQSQFAALVTFCDNDVDRAESLWVYMNLRRAFPETFTEATSAIALGGVTLQPRKTFAGVGTSGTPAQDSAALLYLIMSESATMGVAFSADDVTQGAQTDFTIGSTKYRAFKDAWGTPVTFRRFLSNTELLAPPYVKPGATHTDTLDPLRKLRDWTSGTGPTNKPLGESAVGGTFDGNLKTPTVVSAGPNQGFDSGSPVGSNATGTTDDVFGYRLRRQGTRGD